MPTLTQPAGLPESIHTEVTILGAMLLDTVATADAVEKLHPSDFFLDSHQRIFSVMLSMYQQGRPIDLTTVSAELAKHRQLDAIGGPAYLAGLTNDVPRQISAEAYVNIVKEKSLLRQLMGIGQDLLTRAADPSGDAINILADVEGQLAEVSDAGIHRGLSDIPEIVRNGFQIDQVHTEGLRTHFLDFDHMTHGLQASELIIIAARPSMGKTAWAMNVAQNAAVRDQKVVAVFSLEMSKEALLRRMLAGTGRVPTLEKLMNSRLFIDDTPGISLQELRAKARRLKQEQKELDLIVVDYLQLMTTPKAENRNHEVGGLSRGLKALAKELKVPVLALSQLSRGNEKRAGDKRPFLSDLRDSGSIEQDADVVAFIHREEYYDRDNPEVQGKAEVILAKQRNGPTGTVHLAWLSDSTTFENLGRQ